MSAEDTDLLRQILDRLVAIEHRLGPIDQQARTAAHGALDWQVGPPPSNSHVVMEQLPTTSVRIPRWRYA